MKTRESKRGAKNLFLSLKVTVGFHQQLDDVVKASFGSVMQGRFSFLRKQRKNGRKRGHGDTNVVFCFQLTRILPEQKLTDVESVVFGRYYERSLLFLQV